MANRGMEYCTMINQWQFGKMPEKINDVAGRYAEQGGRIL